MKIDHLTSLKIDALRFPLIVAVVFIHMGTNYSGSIVGSSDLATIPFKYVIQLVSIVISSAAVPLFFLISAFLFFADFQFTFEWFSKKLRSRIRTLLVPYIFWNLSYLLFKLIVQTNPMLSSKIGGTTKRILDYTCFDYFDALLAWTNFPISYQFWFIRDLIIMIVLAPLIWLAIRKLSWLPTIFFMIIWIADLGRIANIHNEAWFFFSLGCLIAQGKLNIKINANYQYVLLYTYVILAAAITALNVAGLESPVLSKLITLGGVAAIWYASDMMISEGKFRDALIRMSAYSFFIFAAHEPLLGMAAKVIGRLSILDGYTAAFLMYFALPMTTIALLLSIGLVLKQRTPRFYGLVTGGRSRATVS